MLGGLIARIKARYMNHILHKQIYSGLFEIIKDKKCYYYSSVGKGYSYLTDEGKEAVVKWIDIMAWEMIELDKQELDIRAKKIMWDELKK